MKLSAKKIFSAILAMIMVFSAVPFVISASAESYEQPVFELSVKSESDTQVVVALSLVSGSFNCADFGFVANSGYTGKAISPSSAVLSSKAIYSENVETMLVSFVSMNEYSAKGEFYTATFTKNTAGKAYKNGDISVAFSNCAISAQSGDSVDLKPVVKVIPVYAPYLTLSYQGNELDGIAAVKIGLFKLYKNVSIDLEFDTNIDYARAEWSSSNSSKVQVDGNGHITNQKFGSRNSDITLKLFDANNKLLAEQTVRVIFYKFSFQLSKLK